MALSGSCEPDIPTTQVFTDKIRNRLLTLVSSNTFSTALVRTCTICDHNVVRYTRISCHWPKLDTSLPSAVREGVQQSEPEETNLSARALKLFLLTANRPARAMVYVLTFRAYVCDISTLGLDFVLNSTSQPEDLSFLSLSST